MLDKVAVAVVSGNQATPVPHRGGVLLSFRP
jgi:hypothetical protein